MGVPWMKRALKGWTKKTTVYIVTQDVIDFETQEVKTEIILDCNFQPTPPAVVNRKPEDQRTWKWWSILVKDGQLLKTDDIIIKNDIAYRIMSSGDWSESGFQHYEAIEDYTTDIEEGEEDGSE